MLRRGEVAARRWGSGRVRVCARCEEFAAARVDDLYITAWNGMWPRANVSKRALLLYVYRIWYTGLTFPRGTYHGCPGARGERRAGHRISGQRDGRAKVHPAPPNIEARPSVSGARRRRVRRYLTTWALGVAEMREGTVDGPLRATGAGAQPPTPPIPRSQRWLKTRIP